MDFSFVFPTLGNKDLVRRFLDSLERTTYDTSKIEVLIAIDIGKTEIVEYVESLCYSFSIKFFERPTTDNFSDDYYNWLANKSVGKNIWAVNDDVWFKTRHWDEIIRERIKNHGWSAYLIDTTDSTRGKINKDFCCFPLISRRAVEEIGFLFYKQIRIYPADKVIYQLFMNAERIINCRDVILHSTYVSEENNKRLWNIYQEDRRNGCLNIDISKELLILLKIGCKDKVPKKDSKFKKIINIIKEK